MTAQEASSFPYYGFANCLYLYWGGGAGGMESGGQMLDCPCYCKKVVRIVPYDALYSTLW